MNEKKVDAEALQARLDELEVWRLDQFQPLDARIRGCKTADAWAELISKAHQINEIYRRKIECVRAEFGLPREEKESKDDKNAEALQARLDELEAWRQAQFQLINDRNVASEEEAREQLKEIYQLNDAHMRKVAQAHQEYHIPFLQRWYDALSLSASGMAEYRPQRLYPDQSLKASLKRDAMTGRITFSVQEIFQFPLEWNDLLAESDLLPDRYICNRLLGDYWEAVEPEPKPDKETHNEGAYHDAQ